MRLFKAIMSTFQGLVSLVKYIKLLLESSKINPKFGLLGIEHTRYNKSMIKIFVEFSMVIVV